MAGDISYSDFVTLTLWKEDKDPEPFCPFQGGMYGGYCNAAYSESCYECVSSRYDYEQRRNDDKSGSNV